MQASKGLEGVHHAYHYYKLYKTLFLFYRRGLKEAGKRAGVLLYGIKA